MKFAISLLLFTMSFMLQAQISLRFQPVLYNDMKQLGEMVIITPENQVLSHLPLDPSLLSGSFITKKQLFNWLTQKTASNEYEWQGKKTALIQLRKTISSVALVKMAQDKLYERLQQREYETIKLIPKTTPTNSSGTLSEFKIKIKESYPPAKRLCVYLYNDQLSIPVWFEIKAYQSVLTAQHNIPKHTVLSAHDFSIQKQDIAGLASLPLTQIPSDTWLNHSLTKGEVLTLSHISPKPAIIKDSKVHVHIHAEGVIVSTEAIADEDGYQGQTITLHNMQSKKQFHALVSAPNEAEVNS